MSNFREDLIRKNEKFRIKFNELMSSGEIKEYPNMLWDIILRDRTSIKINGEPYALKDLFHLNLNEGRCKICVFEMVMLFDKLGIYSEAVECVNEALIGTTGSSYGGHWYLEVNVFDEVICIDTSLVIVGSVEAFSSLGHKVIKRYDIDTIFKQDSSLIDYYENMIVNKNLL